MTAKRIIELLAVKHYKDVFVSECKTGPTRGASHRRLDAWAMRRSWVSACAIGYEVKVSRADFLGDTKWHEYLNYCNELSFVAPKGVLNVSELPDSVGFLEVAKNGKRLWVRRKAVYRDIDVPGELYQYILMARTEIHPPNYYSHDRLAYWQEWLAEKDDKKLIGHNVSKRLNELVEQRITKVEYENRDLRSENKNLGELKDVLVKLGLDGRAIWDMGLSVEDALLKIRRGGLDEALAKVATSVEAARKVLREGT